MKLLLTSETAFEAGQPFEVGGVCWGVNRKLDIFQELAEQDQTYGKEFSNIVIITTIVPDDFGWKERKYISRKRKSADIRLNIDYEKFVHSNDKTRWLLYVKNIVDSIIAVEERKKEDFQGLKLIQDIINTLGVNIKDLENL